MKHTWLQRILLMAATIVFTLPTAVCYAQDGGSVVYADLWCKAVLKVQGNPVTLIWKEVGSDTTPSGDRVVSGYFYADPNDFAYGSQYNPEAFVKVYIASNGWANIAYNHVTVDDVDVYSAHNYGQTPDKSSTVTLSNRLAEHQYDGVTDTGDSNGTNECLDSSGVWEFEVTNVRSTCGSEGDWDSTVTITQTDCSVETTGFKNTSFIVAGNAVGSTVTIGPGNYPEAGGTTKATFTVTMTSDTTMTGTESWTWSGPGGSCINGTADINGVKVE